MQNLTRSMTRLLIKLAVRLLDLPLWGLHRVTATLEWAKAELQVQVALQ